MDDGVVFPDADNAVADAEVMEHKEEDLQISLGRRRLLRPQTAQPKVSRAADTEGISSKPQRPFSSFLKNRMEFSNRRVSRQTLRKSHFIAPRKRSPSIPSSDSSVQTAVALDNQQPRSNAEEEKTSPPISQKKAINLNIRSLVIKKDDKDVPQKPPPESRKLTKHSSFETWIEGSPHDSDEYDTDLDIEDFKKKLEEQELIKREKARRKKLGKYSDV